MLHDALWPTVPQLNTAPHNMQLSIYPTCILGIQGLHSTSPNGTGAAAAADRDMPILYYSNGLLQLGKTYYFAALQQHRILDSLYPNPLYI